MALRTEVGLGPIHILLDGDPASPSQKRGHRHQFSAHFYCSQTAAGCIKMPLRMEVGLGPGHIVIDGDPAAPQNGGGAGTVPNFRPTSIVAKQLYASEYHLVQR